MKTLNRTEVDALIRLLDDSDLEIYQHIQTRLVDYGKDVIPLLENAWSSSMDAMMQERIENVFIGYRLTALNRKRILGFSSNFQQNFVRTLTTRKP